jgi:hypothetical protein
VSKSEKSRERGEGKKKEEIERRKEGLVKIMKVETGEKEMEEMREERRKKRR